jgi:hypothetical protein
VQRLRQHSLQRADSAWDSTIDTAKTNKHAEQDQRDSPCGVGDGYIHEKREAGPRRSVVSVHFQ